LTGDKRMLQGFLRLVFPFFLPHEHSFKVKQKVLDDVMNALCNFFQEEADSTSGTICPTIFKRKILYLIYQRMLTLHKKAILNLLDIALLREDVEGRVKGYFDGNRFRLSVDLLFSPAGFIFVVFSGEFHASETTLFSILTNKKVPEFSFGGKKSTLQSIAINITRHFLQKMTSQDNLIANLLTPYFIVGFNSKSVASLGDVGSFLKGVCIKDANWRTRAVWPTRLKRIGNRKGDIIILCRGGISYIVPTLEGKQLIWKRKRFRERLSFIQNIVIQQSFLLSEIKNNLSELLIVSDYKTKIEVLNMVFQSLNPYVFLDKSLDIFQSSLLLKTYKSFVEIYEIQSLYDNLLNDIKLAISRFPASEFIEIFEYFYKRKIPKVNAMLGLLRQEKEKEDVIQMIIKTYNARLEENELKVIDVLAEKYIEDVISIMKYRRPIMSPEDAGWLSTNKIQILTGIKKNIIFGTSTTVSPLKKLLLWDLIEVKKPKKAVGRATYYRIKFKNELIKEYLKKVYFEKFQSNS